MRPDSSATHRLARHAIDSANKPLSTREIDKLKSSILDGLACISGAYSLPGSTEYSTVVMEEGGRPESLVIGSGKRLPASRAALVNGYLMNLLDYDDTYETLGHIGAVVLPATLAVAESVGASGADLLRALNAGYSVAVRIGSALEPTPERKKEVRGFVTWQAFGAIASIATLLKLEEEQIVTAFGIAGCHAPIPYLNKWGYTDGRISWVKNNSGWGAMIAVYSCFWARKGIYASPSMFDGPHGFWKMIGSDRFRKEFLEEEPSPFLERLAIKPYPCCRFLHTTVEAASLIGSRIRDLAERIRSVEISHSMAFVRENFFTPSPRTAIDAQYSLPFVAAVGLIGDPTDPSWYDPSRFDDPAFASLVEMVKGIAGSSEQKAYWPDLTSSVLIRLDSGEELRESVEFPLGGPQRPLSDVMFDRKIRSLLSRRFTPRTIDEIIKTVEEIETRDATTELWRALSNALSLVGA